MGRKGILTHQQASLGEHGLVYYLPFHSKDYKILPTRHSNDNI